MLLFEKPCEKGSCVQFNRMMAQYRGLCKHIGTNTLCTNVALTQLIELGSFVTSQLKQEILSQHWAHLPSQDYPVSQSACLMGGTLIEVREVGAKTRTNVFACLLLPVSVPHTCFPACVHPNWQFLYIVNWMGTLVKKFCLCHTTWNNVLFVSWIITWKSSQGFSHHIADSLQQQQNENEGE